MDSSNQVLILTLPQVIDAALTGPELGTVSYRLLNNILQVMCQQLALQDVKLQYQGVQAHQLQKVWDPNVKSKIPTVTGLKKTKATADSVDTGEMIVVIPDGPSDKFPAVTLAISNTQVQNMERNIRSLQKEVSDLKALPSNSELFRAVKAKSGDPTPLLDMYKILTITKRMDATEQAVMKIASFVEDLAKFVQEDIYTPSIQDFEVDSGELPQQGEKRTSKVTITTKTAKEGKHIFSSALGSTGGQDGSVAAPGAPVATRGHRFSGTTASGSGARGSLVRGTSGSKGSRILGTLDISSLTNLGLTGSRLERLSHPVINTNESIDEEGFAEKRLKKKLAKKDKVPSGSSESSGSKTMDPMFELPDTKLTQNVNIIDMPNLDALNLVQDELRSLRGIVEVLMNKMLTIASGGGGSRRYSASITNDRVMEISGTGGGPAVGGLRSLVGEPGSVGGEDGTIVGENDQGPVGTGAGATDQGLSTRISNIELKVNQCITQINKMDAIFSNSYNGITNRLADLEGSVKLLSHKALKDSGKADIEEQLSQSIYSVNQKVMNAEGLISKMSDAIALLLEENTTKQNKIMNLMDVVDFLKSDKISREEFTEALSEKVDLCMINRKVSHDQFNATCDDLSKGIEDALEKLMEQEGLWHVALREIQEEISEKLGKGDLDPLKEFVTEKLKGLQHRVKTLTKMKREQEAAATKSKFLTGVQCISCDKDVIMRKQVDVTEDYPSAPTLPSHKSMAPYLAYELDQLRKQQQQMQYGKNLLHFEAATHDAKGTVNRYCGGTHTITTPQQRVTRLGNFVDQWGPKVVHVDESEISIIENQSKPVGDKAIREGERRARMSKESLTIRNWAERELNESKKTHSEVMTALAQISDKAIDPVAPTGK